MDYFWPIYLRYFGYRDEYSVRNTVKDSSPTPSVLDLFVSLSTRIIDFLVNIIICNDLRLYRIRIFGLHSSKM